MSKDKISYKITIDPEYAENGEDLGIEMIAFTKTPAILVKGMAFNSQSRKQIFNDNLKYRIAAPALIPMEIYRNDEAGEYFVEFTKEEIEDIYVKLMSNKPDELFNLEHNDEDKVGAFILESWLVGKDTKADRSFSEFGIDVPEGTLMIVSQFTDKERYTELVNNDQVGYSIEGFLGLKLSKQEFEGNVWGGDAGVEWAQNKLKQIDKNKQKMEENKMVLPDGTHKIGDKEYVIKDGQVVDILTVVAKGEYDEETGEIISQEEVALEEEVIEEEVALEEVIEEVIEEVALEEVIEEVALEEVIEEELAVDPIVDEAVILEILQPKLDEIYEMIAELKAAMEMDVKEESVEEVQMSKQEAFKHSFSAITNFLSK